MMSIVFKCYNHLGHQLFSNDLVYNSSMCSKHVVNFGSSSSLYCAPYYKVPINYHASKSTAMLNYITTSYLYLNTAQKLYFALSNS